MCTSALSSRSTFFFRAKNRWNTPQPGGGFGSDLEELGDQRYRLPGVHHVVFWTAEAFLAIGAICTPARRDVGQTLQTSPKPAKILVVVAVAMSKLVNGSPDIGCSSFHELRGLRPKFWGAEREDCFGGCQIRAGDSQMIRSKHQETWESALR